MINWTWRERLSCMAAMLVVAAMWICPAMAGPGEAPNKDSKEKLIDLQINSDMLYGTDDYFGDTRDVVYIDTVVPSSGQGNDGGASSSGQSTTAPDVAPPAPPDGGGDCPS